MKYEILKNEIRYWRVANFDEKIKVDEFHFDTGLRMIEQRFFHPIKKYLQWKGKKEIINNFISVLRSGCCVIARDPWYDGSIGCRSSMK